MGCSEATGTTHSEISMKQEWYVSLKNSYWGTLMGMRSLGKVVERNRLQNRSKILPGLTSLLAIPRPLGLALVCLRANFGYR